ncbi:MAG: Carbohydrate binding module (family 6), partial [Paenibacillaceae bacterium]|nr:Carbohydrate binding module (family 6) [Paenibacillaceae bacterium]
MFTNAEKRLFRWGTSALLTVVLAVGLIPYGAMANTTGRIKITAESLSQKITDWGYDIKQGGKATGLTTARAQEVFVTDGMDILRIPIYAALAHPSNGTVTGSYYTDTVDAVGRVKAVKSSVKVFASLKLDGTNTYPSWVLNADGTVKDCSATSCPYGDLLYDYLNYMKGQTPSVIVDVLGMDNEDQFNKGDITPQKFADIVDYLQTKCSANGIAFPQMIAPENYGPSSYTWLDTLFGSSLGGRLDIAGVHYYSANRTASYLTKLQQFANSAGSKTLWDSEFHWNGTIGTTYDNAVAGLIAAFDEFDNLFQGMSWWSFNPESVGTIDSQLQTALVTSTTDAYPAYIDDQDGPQLNPGEMNTRAFKQGRNLNLWVLNDTATGYSAKWVEIPGKTVSAAPSYTQWDGTTKTTGSGVIVNSDTFTLNLPAKT